MCNDNVEELQAQIRDLERLLEQVLENPMEYSHRKEATDFLGIDEPANTNEFVHQARELYGDANIEFDDKAPISEGEDGTWVVAWVRVPKG